MTFMISIKDNVSKSVSVSVSVSVGVGDTI